MTTPLTTRQRVKDMVLDDPAAIGWHDSVIDRLIPRVSGRIESSLNRIFAETVYTSIELDGDGTPLMILPQGPLVSVENLWSVSYNSTGEDTDLIAATDYILESKRDQDSTGRGRIRLNGSLFNDGHQNYRVDYTAGWEVIDNATNAIPDSVIDWATFEVAYEFTTRRMPGISSRQLGDGSIIKGMSPKDLREERFAALSDFAIADQLVF